MNLEIAILAGVTFLMWYRRYSRRKRVAKMKNAVCWTALLLFCGVAQAQEPRGVRVRSYDHGKIEWTELSTGKDYTSTCAAKVTIYYPTLYAVNSKACELLGPSVAGKSILHYAPGTGVVVVFTTPTLVFRIDLPDRSIIETFTPSR